MPALMINYDPFQFCIIITTLTHPPTALILQLHTMAADLWAVVRVRMINIGYSVAGGKV